MSNCSCGISDNRSSVPILATRIFDNVRLDLDRDSALFNAALPHSAWQITPLYAGGTGVCDGSTLCITPRYGNGYADVCGNLQLLGNLTYLYQGTAYTAQGNLILPFCAQMQIPENSVWPFDFTVHYSFYADSINYTSDNDFSCIADGITICYITASMPVSVQYNGVIEYNSLSSRAPQPENAFVTSAFYPVKNTQF